MSTRRLTGKDIREARRKVARYTGVPTSAVQVKRSPRGFAVVHGGCCHAHRTAGSWDIASIAQTVVDFYGPSGGGFDCVSSEAMIARHERWLARGGPAVAAHVAFVEGQTRAVAAGGFGVLAGSVDDNPSAPGASRETATT